MSRRVSLRYLSLACVCLWIIGETLVAQRAAREIRLMQWNVENLFDCRHDEGKNDYEFLPDGAKQWTEPRLRNKLKQIAEVISFAGEEDWPAFIGLAEVENDNVLLRLMSQTALKSADYRYLLSQSLDERGIEVALLYRSDCFSPIRIYDLPIRLPDSSCVATRNILYTAGLLPSGKQLHLFICHFPSRRGGSTLGHQRRQAATQTLRAAIDSIYRTDEAPLIVAMGDFNAEPSELSNKHLGLCFPKGEAKRVALGKGETDTRTDHRLIALSDLVEEHYPSGSYLFQGVWSHIDQIFVSSATLEGTGFKILPQSFRSIVAPSAVESRNGNSAQIRPKRTFLGNHYHGGVSDHLPIIVDARIGL